MDNYFYDYKSKAIIDYSKIENLHIQRISNINACNPEVILHMLEHNKDEKLYCKNFIRYKIATKLNLYTIPSFDCDKLPEVMDQLKLRLKVNKILYTDYHIEGKVSIQDHGQNLTFQTDTLYSMQTLWGSFIRNFLKKSESKWVEIYCKKYIPSEWNPNKVPFYRDFYWLENIDRWYDKLSPEEKESLELFNCFARLTHTIGNFILVPEGFNTGRYVKTKDFIYPTIEYLQEMVKEKNYISPEYEWYCNHIDLFLWSPLLGEQQNVPFHCREISQLFRMTHFTNSATLNYEELNTYLEVICKDISDRNIIYNNLQS